MIRWLLAGFLLMLAGLGVATLLLRRYDRRQALYQSRLRTSQTYQAVYPVIKRCESLPVESISLRPEAIVITLFDPPGKTFRYVFEEHGLDNVAPEPLQALAQAFALDLPGLAKRSQYSFRVHSEQIGVETIRWYKYVIQPRYKDFFLRQRYDHMAS